MNTFGADIDLDTGHWMASRISNTTGECAGSVTRLGIDMSAG